ncbi:DUF3592 domain-containing protein [Nocardiopsis sp. Huas11]|uniref:DUF3592 domain-containing protein n=1 Tax=Nocardiopsis sp. Huas11 TaxID=2183912 RepID=UPI0011C345AA|nr:DUF3592 domain-containing protein [Nocardiopsis sp. Huas11]
MADAPKGEHGGCLSVPREVLGELLGYALLFVLLAVLPAVVAWHGGRHLWRIMRLRRSGRRATGRIDRDFVAWRPTRSGVRGRARAPFAFHTPEGEEVAARQRLTLGFNGLRGGEWVEIAYDPQDPSNAEIVGARSQIAAAAVLLVGGLLFTALYPLAALALVADALGR